MKGMRRNVEMFRINKAGDGGWQSDCQHSIQAWGPVEDEEDQEDEDEGEDVYYICDGICS